MANKRRNQRCLPVDKVWKSWGWPVEKAEHLQRKSHGRPVEAPVVPVDDAAYKRCVKGD